MSSLLWIGLILFVFLIPTILDVLKGMFLARFLAPKPQVTQH